MTIKQSSAAKALMFLMVDSADHVTPKTGLSPTVTLSKNGGAFAAPAGAVTEVANGWYKVAANATDSNTLGQLVLHATGAGADPADQEFEVVAYDPDDAVSLGLSRIDATISSRSTLTAAGVWDALLTGITTVGSIGKLLKDSIDATVSSRSSHSVADIWAAATRTLSAGGVQAIWDALTANLTTANSIGKRLADNINATISSRATPAGVWDVDLATWVQIPDSFGVHVLNLVTLDDYVAPDNASITAIKAKTDNLPVDPADQSILAGLIAAVQATADGIPFNVWNDDLASYVGTDAGQLLKNVNTLAERLTTAIELDGAVWRYTANALEQAPAGGGGGGGLTAPQEAKIDAIKAKTDTIGNVSILVVSPYTSAGVATLYKGFDYTAAHSQQIDVEVSTPDLTDADEVRIKDYDTGDEMVGTVLNPGLATQMIRFEFLEADLTALEKGSQIWVIEADMNDGQKVRIGELTIKVRE